MEHCKESLLKSLTEEQIAKVRACKTQEELLALAKQEDIELTEEQLEAVSGGCTTPVEKFVPCPKCKSIQVEREFIRNEFNSETYCTCKQCGHKWIL